MQKTETLGRLRCGLRSLNPIAGLLFEEGLGLSLGSRDLGGYFNCLSLEAENLSARSQKVWQGDGGGERIRMSQILLRVVEVVGIPGLLPRSHPRGLQWYLLDTVRKWQSCL